MSDGVVVESPMIVVSTDGVTWVVVEAWTEVVSFVVDFGSMVVDDGVLHDESHSHEHVQYVSLVIVLTPSDISGKVVLHVVGTVNGGTHLQPQTQF